MLFIAVVVGTGVKLPLALDNNVKEDALGAMDARRRGAPPRAGRKLAWSMPVGR
jgi:hypothetical protein